MKKRIASILPTHPMPCKSSKITKPAVNIFAASYLIVSSSRATCISAVSVNSTATKILAIQHLQKKNGTAWSTVSKGTWSDLSGSNSLTMSNSKSGLSNGTYRLKTVFKAYSGNDYETIIRCSSEKNVDFL